MTRDKLGRFVKGINPLNKGFRSGDYVNCKICKKKIYQYKSKKRIYCSHKCAMRRNKHAKGKPSWNKGKNLSNEHKRNLSISNKGNLPWNTGIKTGLKPWNYIDGRSKLLSPARYGDDWFKIRIVVYRRDNYTCQECGLTMSELKTPFHIHHIVPFLISFDNSLSNLITLCPSCHRKIEAKIMNELKTKEVRNFES